VLHFEVPTRPPAGFGAIFSADDDQFFHQVGHFLEICVGPIGLEHGELRIAGVRFLRFENCGSVQNLVKSADKQAF
jgi:hypothetical protein